MVIGVGYDDYRKAWKKDSAHLAAMAFEYLEDPRRGWFALDPIMAKTAISYTNGLGHATKEESRSIAKELIEERS